MESWISIVL